MDSTLLNVTDPLYWLHKILFYLSNHLELRVPTIRSRTLLNTQYYFHPHKIPILFVWPLHISLPWPYTGFPLFNLPGHLSDLEKKLISSTHFYDSTSFLISIREISTFYQWWLKVYLNKNLILHRHTQYRWLYNQFLRAEENQLSL